MDEVGTRSKRGSTTTRDAKTQEAQRNIRQEARESTPTEHDSRPSTTELDYLCNELVDASQVGVEGANRDLQVAHLAVVLHNRERSNKLTERQPG